MADTVEKENIFLFVPNLIGESIFYEENKSFPSIRTVVVVGIAQTASFVLLPVLHFQNLVEFKNLSILLFFDCFFFLCM